MKTRLAVAGFFLVVAVAAYAQPQTCLPGGFAPASPPAPSGIIVNFPPVDGGSFTLNDGGTFQCIGFALGGVAPSKPYGGKIPQCATARTLGDQWIANDNGWNDGGVP